MRGKQKPPKGRDRAETTREKNNPLKPIEVAVVIQDRIKPAHTSIRDAIMWSDEEKEVIMKVEHNLVLKVRQEKLLLHNRTAKENQYHDYLPLRNARQTDFICRLCKKVVPCKQTRGGKTVGLDTTRMKKQCPENLDSPSEQINRRNKYFREWNEKPNNKDRHLFYLVTEKSGELIVCQKKGCQLNVSPARWPNRQSTLERIMGGNPCVGDPPCGDLGKLGKNVVPEAYSAQ